ncbi:MAG: general secretion pathway protein GspB [Candidatus Omnitrophica bacterium]|nr:general secretion pathway protein GspB [Candidatus Omnitrophota bacterium]
MASRRGGRYILIGCICIAGCMSGTAWAEAESSAASPDVFLDAVFEKFIYDDGGRPDPFVPFWKLAEIAVEQISPEEQARRLFEAKMRGIAVNGVLWDAQQPLVMVNGKIYHQGDRIDDVAIEQVQTNAVVFAFQDLRKEIRIITIEELDGQGGTDGKP